MLKGQFRAIAASNPAGGMKFPTVAVKDLPEPVLRGDGGEDRTVVLVVHDQRDVAESVLELLNRNGYAAIAASTGEDAIETALLIPPELVISEVTLPDMSGVEVAKTLKAKLPGTKVLLFADEGAAPELLAAVKKSRHGIGLVEKPIVAADVIAHVSASLKTS